MAKVHDFLDMWKDSQILCVTLKESRAQYWQMTTVGHILDAEEMINPSWSVFQLGCAAAFELSQ
jgi:hypothetical protein